MKTKWQVNKNKEWQQSSQFIIVVVVEVTEVLIVITTVGKGKLRTQKSKVSLSLLNHSLPLSLLPFPPSLQTRTGSPWYRLGCQQTVPHPSTMPARPRLGKRSPLSRPVVSHLQHVFLPVYTPSTSYIHYSFILSFLALISSPLPSITFLSAVPPFPHSFLLHISCTKIFRRLRFILLSSPPTDDRFCPEGNWVQLEDHCYLSTTEEKSWTAAEADCKKRNRNAHLTSILTWSELDFVRSKLVCVTGSLTCIKT